jgi:hypothetical protein
MASKKMVGRETRLELAGYLLGTYSVAGFSEIAFSLLSVEPGRAPLAHWMAIDQY